jgi:hypothetical protein
MEPNGAGHKIEGARSGAGELPHEGKPLGFADVSRCGGLPRVLRRASPILTMRQASRPLAVIRRRPLSNVGPLICDVRCGSAAELAKCLSNGRHRAI